MTARIIRVGPGECSDVETGARYFAALAFPTPSEEIARLDAVVAWVASYLHEANRMDKTKALFEDERLNGFVKISPEWCRAKLRTTSRRLRDRGIAARAVRPWIRELLDDPWMPVEGVRKFSQRQIALFLCKGSSKNAVTECEAKPGPSLELVDNFQKRVWRPARPVIHLLAANDRVLSSTEVERTNFKIDLASTAFIRFSLELAAKLEPLVCGDSRFGVDENQLLKFEWIT